jgi:transcription elongation factor GreA
VEGRILELEIILASARVIDEKSKKDKSGIAQIGSTVTISEDGGKPEKYTIVGAAEANPREGRISNESPIGRTILNHRAGEELTVEAPGGTFKVKIVKVE